MRCVKHQTYEEHGDQEQKHRAEACSTARALDRERITLQLESCYDRLGSKGDFMGVVAHICKQLLNVRQRAFHLFTHFASIRQREVSGMNHAKQGFNVTIEIR